MSNSNSIRRAVRYALLTGAAAAVSGIVPAQAQAQNNQAPIAEVVVTGTRIMRADYQAASPVVTVNEEAFKQTGSTTVETMLNTLPQFVPSLTNTSNNPSNGGQANVELRGLGTTRTLVLMDGKRVVPANGTGVVDVNMLPSTLIESVEIISGGASATYGSDAVAGVVNFRLKDFEGLEFDTNWGQTTESDGQEWQVSVTGGTRFADGRGKVVANVSYSERDAILAAGREWSRVAYGWFPELGGFAPLGSGSIEEGRVTVAAPPSAVDALFQSYGFAPGAAGSQNIFGFNSDGTLFTLGSDSPGSVLNYKGEITDSFNDASYSYNYAPSNYLQLPLERTTAFVRGSFELTPQAELYAQGIFASYEADTQLAPTPASSMFIPVTNPYVSADLAALAAAREEDPGAPLALEKRVSELGPRYENNAYDTFQVLTGIRGNLFDGKWAYDVYGSYGKTEVDNIQLGSLSRTRFEELTFAPDGGASICGGLNPFGAGSMSQECVDYIKVDALNTIEAEQTVVEATLSGALFSLPAGEVHTAFGVFYKEDKFAFIADEKLRARTTGDHGLPVRPDVAGFNASDNTIGKTDSTEFYVEAAVPLLAGLPGVELLEATLGYRYADYSTAGGVDSYKAELTYTPSSPFLVRGSYQRAVRAPNITELFQPQVTSFPSVPGRDPCRVSSDERNGAFGAQVRDLCLAQGLPGGLIDSYNNGNTQADGLAGGNPELFEETADTFTLGVVFRSESSNPWLSGLQVAVDWYQIEIEDAIDSVSAATFVPRCYDPAFNPDFSVDNFYCSFFTRSTFNGQIINALELEQNIGAIKTSGIDVQIDWAADVGPGRLGMNWVVAWLDKYDRQELPGDPFEARAGTIASNIAEAYPKWKWTYNLHYTIADITMTARWRYIHGMTDTEVTTFELPSMSYIDLSAAYAFSTGVVEGITLRAGVTNLMDKDPIIYPSSVQSNTDPSTYDVLGRRYFVAASYRF